MNPVDKRSDQSDIGRLDPDRLRASRRSAILKGLGKGSAALAAMSPLASQASRSHVLFNPLKATDCYCTVSGFQSAAVSPSTGANPPTCATYLPRTFLTMTAAGGTSIRKIVYATDVSPLNDNKIADLLNLLLGITSITGTQVSNTLRAATPLPLIVAGSNAVFRPLSAPNASTGCYFLKSRNFPSGIISTGTFKSIFTNSLDQRTLLEVLFEGVSTADGGEISAPPTAKCYFLASYLSISNSLVSSVLPVDLDRPYVVANYSDTNAALTADAGLFFSKLCSKSA